MRVRLRRGILNCSVRLWVPGSTARRDRLSARTIRRDSFGVRGTTVRRDTFWLTGMQRSTDTARRSLSPARGVRARRLARGSRRWAIRWAKPGRIGPYRAHLDSPATPPDVADLQVL